MNEALRKVADELTKKYMGNSLKVGTKNSLKKSYSGGDTT